MDHRQAYRFSNIFGIAGVLVGLCVYFFEEMNWCFYLVAATSGSLLLAALIITLLYYKCPHCHERLPARAFGPPAFCPHCGEKID